MMSRQLDFKIAHGTHQGTVRPSIDDYSAALALSSDSGQAGALLIIADGWQGEAENRGAGRAASKLVVDSIQTSIGLIGHHFRRDASKATRLLDRHLRQAVATANARLLAQPVPHGFVTGFAGLLAMNDMAFLVNHADCPGYMLRGGQLRLVTRNEPKYNDVQHAYGAWIGETRAIRFNHGDESGMNEHEAILRANARSAIQLNIWREQLEPGDRLLLCTDGLWGLVDDDTLTAILREANTTIGVISELLAAAEAGGGVDNITAAVCDVSEV